MTEASQNVKKHKDNSDTKNPVQPIDKDNSTTPPKPKKPPKPEDKPFEEFINTELIPSLSLALKNRGVSLNQLTLSQGDRPVVGGTSWILFGELFEGRRFWLCFSEKNITSKKTITLSEGSKKPSLLESFLIDEKKITLALLQSRLIQRLNGQKWLDAN